MYLLTNNGTSWEVGLAIWTADRNTTVSNSSRTNDLEHTIKMALYVRFDSSWYADIRTLNSFAGYFHSIWDIYSIGNNVTENKHSIIYHDEL